jgi:hypothetical protein
MSSQVHPMIKVDGTALQDRLDLLEQLINQGEETDVRVRRADKLLGEYSQAKRLFEQQALAILRTLI